MNTESYVEPYPISLEDPGVGMALASVMTKGVTTVADAKSHVLESDPRPTARYNDLLTLVQGEDHPQISMLHDEKMRFIFCGDTVEIGNPQTKETTPRVFALIYAGGRPREIAVNLTDLWDPERDRIVVLETEKNSFDTKRK